MSQPERASLAGIPAELFDDICTHLSQHTLTLLARTCKAVKEKIQNPLYYHASVRGFTKLALFDRTMADSAKYDRRGDIISKNVQDLRLTLDPKKEEGNRSTAVVLGRMVASVSRYCPRIKIHLVLENATCSGQPIASFYQESFPRVTTLILNTGPGEPAPTNSSMRRPQNQVVLNTRSARNSLSQSLARDMSCRPNMAFWTGIFNGTSFPNLEDVEIHHVQHRGSWAAPNIDSRDLKGLRHITRLAVNSAPELNGPVLLGALQCAPNLKHLELKNISGLDYSVLATLLIFALPNLVHFTLHVQPMNGSAQEERDRLRDVDPLQSVDPTVTPVHLCPLIREHGKNIPYLDIFLPCVCRELFLSVNERLKLSEAGVKILVGGSLGERQESIDKLSIVKVVSDHRKALAQAKFQATVRENVVASKKEGKEKVITLAEYEEEQKQFQRARLIKKESWKRIVRIGRKLCRSNESWEELGVLAGLDEEGISWALGNERLNLGGTYTAGSVGIDRTYDEMFPAVPGSQEALRIENMRVPETYNRADGYDHNDD